MPAPRPPVRWARFLASLLAIGLAGLAVALIVPRVVPERSSPGPVDPEVNPEEIVHLHALGVNPGDGLPYLATHTGVLTYDQSGTLRYEQRRVGKEGVSTCRSRWSRYK